MISSNLNRLTRNLVLIAALTITSNLACSLQAADPRTPAGSRPEVQQSTAAGSKRTEAPEKSEIRREYERLVRVLSSKLGIRP
jgi:hypothetical protein